MNPSSRGSYTGTPAVQGQNSGAGSDSDKLACIIAASTRTHDAHIGRRVFIGPMPEKIISHVEHEIKRKMVNTGAISLNQLEAPLPEDSEDVVKVIRSHARRFTTHYRPYRRDTTTDDGSIAEENDWDEDYERNLTEEIIQKWKESEWGKAWSKRRSSKHEARQHAHQGWVGGSFEIGSLLGVNVLHRDHSKPYASQRMNPSALDAPKVTLKGPDKLQANVGSESLASGSAGGQDRINSINDSTADSRTGLLPSLPRSASDRGGSPPKEPTRVLDSTRAIVSDSQLSAKARGKQHQVHYEDGIGPNPSGSSSSAASAPPAPPNEILERTGSDVDPKTSEAAMLTAVDLGVPLGDVIMRDRMLVRVVYSKSEGLSPKFDDSIHRTTRNLQYEDWGEFMVAWRRDLIEIYEDHKVPGRELLTGTKHLAFIVPLKSSRTSLSMYSFVDLTFCITCPPMSPRLNANHRWIFSRSKPGTNIFIFKHKSRSRSWDWIWKLWRHREGEIPRTIQVFNPRVNIKVTVDIPFRREIDSQELYDMFTRKNIVALCINSLRSVPDWFSLVEQEIAQHGKRLELCWRRDASLDWMWLETDAFGNSRPWALMAALAVVQSSRPPSLEIRLTSHVPTHYHLKDGTEIKEPPSVEGYVERIKHNTQFKQSLYLSTLDGCLLTNHIDKAYPPAPPGIALTLQDLDSWVTGLRQAEVQRRINQVMHASGVCELRNIVVVRRAFQPVPPTTHDLKDARAGDDTGLVDIWESPEPATLDDDEDEGGEAYLAHVPAADRPMVRIRRSFELLLNTGHVIRFEVYSRKVAIEWINKLRALVGFWKHKYRIEAKEEMELVQARRPRLTPQVRVCHEEDSPPEAPADMSAPYPAMESLYNWCVIEGCNPITKGGKVYMRKGLRGQYKLVQLFLVAGHLVRFRIKPGSPFHTTTHKRINLMDAYVYSGYFAAMNLPKGQFCPNRPAAPRRYQDGLETDDREEDMLFMIYYRAQPAISDAEQTPTITAAQSKTVPALSMQEKVLVLQTRSRIERDAWCWVLNTEIEKIVRAQREREEKLMTTGQLMELNK